MEVTVVEASPHQVVLSAPLAPNINHRETVFGGSASAVAILAAWSMLHLRLSAEGLGSRLVVQRKGLGRIAQASALHYQGQPAGQLVGEFVAFGPGYS